MNWTKVGLILIVSGCATAQPLSHRGMMVLMPQTSSGRLSETIVYNYTREDINHLKVHLYTVDGETEQDTGLERILSYIQLDTPTVFNNLTEQTHYRVKAAAYASSDDSMLISTSDASSSTDVHVAYDDRPVVAPLRLQLIDKPFGAQFLDSVVIYHRFLPAGSESISAN